MWDKPRYVAHHLVRIYQDHDCTELRTTLFLGDDVLSGPPPKGALLVKIKDRSVEQKANIVWQPLRTVGIPLIGALDPKQGSDVEIVVGRN